MNFRRLLNISTTEHKALIDADVEKLNARFKKLAYAEVRDQKEAQECHDNTCPKCQSSKEHIVNKISKVVGSGLLDRTIIFGKINSSLTINTIAVNHCNICGNEWDKYKTKVIHGSNIAGTAFNYLHQYMKNDTSLRHSFKEEVLDLFSDVYAEAIIKFYRENSGYCYDNTKIHRIFILPYFKSVYDKKPRELKELY